ncbi:MAG TPA: signal peptidase I [Planctomycetes bacterium]|nr:signal peptidase I [Planctomycetota bacterium]
MSDKPQERGRYRTTIESLAVAVVMALLIKQFAFEAFQVPTESMEPVIIGRPQGGYRLIVNKYVYQVRDPRRWEVVVFRYPLERLMNYVKRLVGIGPEWLFIRNGDIYTAPAELEHDEALKQAKIQRKPANVQDDLFDLLKCIPPEDRNTQAFRRYWKQEGGDRGQGDIRVLVDDEEVEFTAKGGMNLVSFTLPDRYAVRAGQPCPPISNRRFDDFAPIVPPRSSIGLMLGLPGPAQGNGPIPGHEAEVGDVRLAMDVNPQNDAGTFVMEIRDGTHGRVIRLELAAEGSNDSSRLVFGDQSFPIDAKLETDSWTPVSLANVDDAIHVEVDGDEVFSTTYEHPMIPVVGAIPESSQTSPPPAVEPRDVPVQPTHDLPHDNGVSFGCSGGRVRMRDIDLARDLYYSFSGVTDFRIPEDHYLMLGDNSPNSLDCRAFQRADLRYRGEDGKVSILSGDFEGVGAENRHHEGSTPAELALRPMHNPFDDNTRFIDVFGNLREIDPDRIEMVPDPFHPDRGPVPVETWYDHYVPKEFVLGRAYLVFWPPLQIGVIR